MTLRSIFASSLGNILEWYDFGLFIFFSTIFAHLFFPTLDSRTATISVFGIFAAGFLCRPLGAILLGHLGDRYGRVLTLRFSILFISIPTLLIGCLPTYHHLGIAAPILLTLLRILQGLCMGGEFAGIIIYLGELAHPKHRALTASFAATGANIGILLATGMVALLTHYCTETTIEAGIWRIPFFVSSFLGLLILCLRVGIQETQVFTYLKQRKTIAKIPVLTAITTTPWHIIKTMGLVLMGATLYYTCFGYMSSFLDNIIGFSLPQALFLQTILIASMLILVPLFAIVCDWVGRKAMMTIIAVGIIFFTIPCFYLIRSDNYSYLVLAMIIFTLLSSMEQGTTLITVVENFPSQVRYTGLSLGYNIGYALLGGTSPLIISSLLQYTHNIFIPAYYLIIAASITLFFVLFTIKETKNNSLL